MVVPNVFDDGGSGWVGFPSVTENAIDAAVGSIVSDETIAIEWFLNNARHIKG